MLTFVDVSTSAKVRERTCTGLEVDFRGNEDNAFLSKEDIKNYIMKDYGQYSGRRLEELDLRRIEEILDGKSAVLKSEAYTTKDGILHISISQRQPVVRFISGNYGWYADETGFMFPLQKNYSSRVLIIDGNIPLNVEKDYKGLPKTAKERKWMEGILDLVKYISQHREWERAIIQIHVENKGHLVLIPREGKERFILGRPEDFDRKFGKIEDYYRYIVPTKGEGYYKTVNVAFDGQIVCRK